MSQRGKMKATVRGGSVPSLFRGWKEWQKGDYVFGRYHSRYETLNKGKMVPNYRIEVIEANFKVKEGKDSDKLISPVGKILTLNSAGQLNMFMDGNEKKGTPRLEPGTHVDIEYAGKEKSRKPGDDTLYHTFSKLEAGEVEEVELHVDEEEYDDATDAL